MHRSDPPVASAKGTGATLASLITIAALIGALGWLLARQAEWSSPHILASMVGYAVLGGVVALAWPWRFGDRNFGFANQVTLLRSGLVCLIGGALLFDGASPTVSWSLTGLIALALSLDAVDGWLARRLQQVSAFGARFDLEVDTLLLLILALLLWQSGRVGAWVLAIGLLRYGFVGAGRLLPWLRRPLPESFRRKTVCAVQGIALLLALLPPTPDWLAGAVAAIAALSLIASFATDIAWLARRSRRSEPREPGRRQGGLAPSVARRGANHHL